MAIRVSGMNSGMDTESIVSQLVAAQQTKVDKVTKSKTMIEWKKDAWSTMNSSIYKFYTGALAKVKTYGNFKSKAATASDTTKASITASNTAVAGSYQYRVNQLATAAVLTGGKLDSKYSATTNLTAADKIVDKDPSLSGKEISFSYQGVENILDGEGKQLYYVQTKNADGSVSLNESQTVGKDATLSEGQTLVAATQTVDKNVSYTFSDESSVNDINKFLKDNGITGITASVSAGKISFSNTNGVKADENGNPVAKATASISGDALGALGIATDGITGEASLNVNYVPQLDDEGDEVKDSAGKTVYKAEGGVAAAASALTYKVDNSSIKGDSLVSDLFNFNGSASTTISLGSNYNDITINATDTVDDVLDKFSKQGINAKFDTTNQRIFLTAPNTGAAKDFTLLDGGSGFLSTLGLDAASATKVDGQDSSITLNNVEFTSATNSVNVEGLGLTFDLKAANAEGEYNTVNVSNDVDGVYNMVKDFISEYNKLVASMSTSYYADKCTYDPLTDEEADAMTESQVNKWEEKIKTSILRRDDTLSSVMSTMRSALSSTVEIDGKNYGLSSIGIHTGEYTERGVLHIYGDADDASFVGKDNKLKELLSTDPDKVMNVLAGLTQNLYGSLTTQMKSSTLSSALTLYNDKSMNKQISEYSDTISTMETKLTEMEDRYYKQFSAMETALAKLDSNKSAVSSMLGV